MGEIVEKKIDLDGCAVHFLDAGPAQGRAVIMLHGMKFQAETWRTLGTIETLAALGFHVVAVDLPGFGKSPAHEMAVDDVLAGLVRGLGLVAPVLVGPSMGGAGEY